MDEKGKMSARNREARAAALQPELHPVTDGEDPSADEDRRDQRTHPTWLDRVREAAAPEPDEPLWTPEPVSPSQETVWDVTDTVEPAPPQAPAAQQSAPEPAPSHPGALPETAGAALEENVGLSVRRLRRAAVEMAARDAEANLPDVTAKGRAESEEELWDRAVSLFRNWQARERSRLNSVVAELEGRITRTLAGISLDNDRFERVTSELFRLKKRWEMNRTVVESTLEEETGAKEEESATRQFKTRWYALAIGFLGIVEFLANAPVFGALLPRDPLTEQQLRYVAETSEGWLAGAMRVASQFILRPDAALLAAGVVTFLCVLAHFFGHSLRSLMMQQSARRTGETLGKRSAGEFIVPMVLSGIGLALVIGVLFEARVTLGEVAVDRFAQDSAKIEELRRTASWLRVDGNLVAANEQANRADDLEALAKEQREYAASMSGLSFPILLLNTTLILVAISAAYFHMQDRRRDRFNDTPFERQRRELVNLGDAIQQRVADAMGDAVRAIRELSSLLSEQPLREAPALAAQLEATIVAYRAENGRLRGLDTREIGAFAEPVDLQLVVQDRDMRDLLMRDPEDYETERRDLQESFEKTRVRFTEEATAW